jgi:hypothetical protein
MFPSDMQAFFEQEVDDGGGQDIDDDLAARIPKGPLGGDYVVGFPTTV